MIRVIALLLGLTLSSCVHDDSIADTFYEQLLIDPKATFTEDQFARLDSSTLQQILACLSLDQQEPIALYGDEEVQNLFRARKAQQQLTAHVWPESEFDLVDAGVVNLVAVQQLLVLADQRLGGLSDAAVTDITTYLRRPYIPSAKELYTRVLLLQMLADHYYYQNDVKKSIATLLRAVHLLTPLDKESRYAKTRDGILQALLIYTTREEDAKRYKGICAALFGMLTKEYLETYRGAKLMAYLAEEGIIFEQEQHDDFLALIAERADSPSEQLILLWSQGLEAEIVQSGDHLSFYEEALDQISASCQTKYYQVLLYILASDISENERAHYKGLLSSYADCDKVLREHVEFLMSSYLDSDQVLVEDSGIVDFYHRGRMLSDTLFPGSSTLHLQDYYLLNYIKMCSALETKTELSSRDISAVINTALDTKERDIHRQQVKEAAVDHDLDYISERNQILNQLQDFQDYFPEKRSVYDQLFEWCLRLPAEIDPYSFQTVDLQLLSQQLAEDNAVILNITKGYDSYWYYYYDGEHLHLGSFASERIDSMVSVSYASLTTEGDNVSEVHLEALIDLTGLQRKNVVYIPDGILVGFPPQYLGLGSGTVFTYPSLRHYIEMQAITIDSDAVYLYSYSDSITIRSREVLSYPELPYSISETQAVASMLGKENAQVFSQDFELQDLPAGISSLLHLSTHAYSSTNVRLDNFFLYRQEGKVSKTFGFEVYRQPYLPQVVILSACDSGIGLHSSGAGVQSLSRAFLDNGTKTVIKTLWKVNEKATAEFMVKMYSHWVTGISLYDALEKTKDGFNHHPAYAHPYYWAGFVLEGNPHIYLKMESAE